MAPALIAASTSCCSPLAERMSTRVGRSPRARHTSSPRMPGRLRSSTSTSGRVARARRTVAGPSAAVATTRQAVAGEVALERREPQRVVVGDEDGRGRAARSLPEAVRRVPSGGSGRSGSTAAGGVARSGGRGGARHRHPHDAATAGAGRPGHGAAEVLDPAADRGADAHPAALGGAEQVGQVGADAVVADGELDAVRVALEQHPGAGARAGVAFDVVEGRGDRGVDLARRRAGRRRRGPRARTTATSGRSCAVSSTPQVDLGALAAAQVGRRRRRPGRPVPETKRRSERSCSAAMTDSSAASPPISSPRRWM